MNDDTFDRGIRRRGLEDRGLGSPGNERRGLGDRAGPGPRVAQAKPKTKPKKKNFAICLAQGDEGRTATAWAGWVHSGEIANPAAILQPSIQSAYAAMTAQLVAGEVVDNVWVYGHGDPDGFLHAVPKDGEPESRFDLATASSFIAGNSTATAFHAFCTGDTKIHMYPCNAGLEPEALESARELFCGGPKGKACGPTQWFHLLVRHVRFAHTVPSDVDVVGCPGVRFDSGPATAAELEQALREFDKAIDADRACYSVRYATAMKASMRRSVANEFENNLFIPWFDDLKKAGLVPPKLRKGSVKRDKKVAAMWRLHGAAWPTITVSRAGGTLSVSTMLAMPFLSSTLLDFTQISTLGNWRDAALSDDHVFPHETAWKTSFKSLPAGKLKPC